MIRKGTWILLIVFAALLGAAFYLQKNPIASGASATPSATPSINMLEGWTGDEIVAITLASGGETSVEIVRSGDGNWLIGPDGQEAVSAGKVEELRSQIVSTRALAVLDAGYALDALGLDNPQQALTVKSGQGMESKINIGALTPTETGYYVQVDGASPIVVSKFAVEAILDLLKRETLLEVTPSPDAGQPAPGSTLAPAQ